jgi:hypothetical protein
MLQISVPGRKWLGAVLNGTPSIAASSDKPLFGGVATSDTRPSSGWLVNDLSVERRPTLQQGLMMTAWPYGANVQLLGE